MPAAGDSAAAKRLTARAGRALRLTAELILAESFLLLIILYGTAAAFLVFGDGGFYGDGPHAVPWMVAAVAAMRTAFLGHPLAAAMLAALARREDSGRDRLLKTQIAGVAGFAAFCAALGFVVDLNLVEDMLGMRVASVEALAVLLSTGVAAVMSPILVAAISNEGKNRIERALRLVGLLMAAELFLLAAVSIALQLLEISLLVLFNPNASSRVFATAGADSYLVRSASLVVYASVLTASYRIFSLDYPVVVTLVALLDRGEWKKRTGTFRLLIASVAGYVFCVGLGYAWDREYIESFFPLHIQPPWSLNFLYTAGAVAAAAPFFIGYLARRFEWARRWTGLSGRADGVP